MIVNLQKWLKALFLLSLVLIAYWVAALCDSSTATDFAASGLALSICTAIMLHACIRNRETAVRLHRENEEKLRLEIRRVRHIYEMARKCVYVRVDIFGEDIGEGEQEWMLLQLEELLLVRGDVRSQPQRLWIEWPDGERSPTCLQEIGQQKTEFDRLVVIVGDEDYAV